MKNDNNFPSKLLVVVGPTATGKSDMALVLAQKLNGEIICADSRTVFRQMDIGTAKPSHLDQLRIPHWGLDLVDPDGVFTAADFKAYANAKINEITSRNKLPIMVGGSGMYIDGVIYDYQFQPATDSVLREELSSLSLGELQARIISSGLEMPADAQNPRRLLRLLETRKPASSTDRERGIRSNSLVIGLDADMAILEHRIINRVEQMVADGLVDEVAKLGKKYGWQGQAMQAPGYKAFRKYINGDITLDDAKAEFVKNDRALAKRQKTWFKRNKSIQWLTTEDKPTEAVDIATTYLHT